MQKHLCTIKTNSKAEVEVKGEVDVEVDFEDNVDVEVDFEDKVEVEDKVDVRKPDRWFFSKNRRDGTRAR